MRHALRDPVTHKFIATPKTVEAMQHEAMRVDYLRRINADIRAAFDKLGPQVNGMRAMMDEPHTADEISAGEQEILAEQDAVLAHGDDPETSLKVPVIACCAFITALVAIGVWRWLNG